MLIAEVGLKADAGDGVILMELTYWKRGSGLWNIQRTVRGQSFALQSLKPMNGMPFRWRMGTCQGVGSVWFR